MQDKEYQRLRDAAVAIIREMGVECGGSNVQMGINPDDGANLQFSRAFFGYELERPSHNQAARQGLL